MSAILCVCYSLCLSHRPNFFLFVMFRSMFFISFFGVHARTVFFFTILFVLMCSQFV